MYFLLIKNEENEESSGTWFCSKSNPFSCICNNDSDDDSGTTKLTLMRKCESNHSKEKIDSNMISLEATDQGNLESIENTCVPTLKNI